MPFGDTPSDESSSTVDKLVEPAAIQRLGLAAGGEILLEPDGFRLVRRRGRRRATLHPYESMTHVYAADRMLLIGLTSGLLTIRNADFEDPDEGPREARRLLLARLAERPDGEHWIKEMAAVDRLGDRKGPSFVTWATVVLCVLGTWFQLRDPMVEQIGAFVPDLFARGEYWRAVTAHFLHGISSPSALVTFLFGNIPGIPFHLAINVGGLLVLGHLVERPLGSWKTAIVLACGGMGTAMGIIYAEHYEVIGASGLVSAFAGAILAMELNHPASLPSYWRLPRRLFIAAIVLQFVVIDQLMSRFVAGGAHLGGFAGGYLAAWLLGRPSLENLIPTSRVRLATYCAIAVLILGLLGALPLTRHDMGALERHAAHLLNTPAAVNLYRDENATAWFIATDGGASPLGLDLAVALAGRAVVSTGRMHPGILDTLAEALFQSGNRLGALLTIDEAIRLIPNEAYFIEQRRRFTGERPVDDRPPPPGSDSEGAPPFDEEFDSHPLDPAAPYFTI
jgi:membrane associated rhomboid family serine protease